jgi:RNA polymerase sigma factor (TIGR02999 family)
VSLSFPELFERLRSGDPSALNQIVASLYPEMHRIASRHLRGERSDHTLQTTALVHEAYMKLFDGAKRQFDNEIHFLAVASRVMRQVLVDYARERSSLKRGGSDPNARAALIELEAGARLELLDLIELNDALSVLAAENENLARLVEMRYFGGMTAEESASVLGLSVHVVRYDLRIAQAWLRRKLSNG